MKTRSGSAAEEECGTTQDTASARQKRKRFMVGSMVGRTNA